MVEKKYFKYVILFLLTIGLSYAATTGKIKGRVIDKETGEPIIGANVIVKGTNKGAATDQSGYFTILNVSPGKYTVVISRIGYRKVEISNVRVNSNLTANLETIELTTEEIQGEAVEVTAKRKAVQKDLTATTSIVNSDQIGNLPVTDMNEIVAMQAGMVDGHMRGGRAGEIQYRIDGMSVTDVYDGGQLITVSKDMMKEIQVVSGAFNAEYGQAMSGVVNVTTKSMYDEWGGSVDIYSGDYLTSHTDIFTGTEEINPLATKNLSFTVHGPISDNISVAFNTRQLHWDGWKHGIHKYNPWTSGVNNNGELYPLGSDPGLDSLVIEQEKGITAESSPEKFDSLYNRYQDAHPDPTGDGEFENMQWNEKRYYHGVIGLTPTPKLKFTLQGSYTDFVQQNFNRSYKYNPEGMLTNYEDSYNLMFKINHSLTSNTFYTLGLSQAQKQHEETNDDNYIVYPKLGNTPDGYSFQVGGTNDWREDRTTTTRTIDFNLTSQVDRVNKIKTGIKAQFHKLNYEGYTLQPPREKRQINQLWDNPIIHPDSAYIQPESGVDYSDYVHEPVQLSGYIQDKIELEEFILNVGVRVDYFKPDGKVLADPRDPDIYNPVRAEHMNDSLSERREYWYEKASEKFQISPRLGASFPITASGVVHVSYGHFFQMPNFRHLYRNPEFQLSPGTGNQGIIGNADMKAEKTIKGEIGIKQEVIDNFVLDATAYFRDVRNLTGTRNAIIDLYRGGQRYDKLMNSDFAYVKGLVLSMDYNDPSGMYASLNYTFQVAKGTASDPEEAHDARTSGEAAEVHIVPLNWDQRHTVKLNAGYNQKKYGFNLKSEYGSGMPYTPTASEDISTLLTNKQRMPSTFNIDCNLYYYTELFGLRQKWYVRVENILDRLNAAAVYPRSGEPDFTPEEQRVKNSNPSELINTVEQWFTNMNHYEEPRKVEIGMSINF